MSKPAKQKIKLLICHDGAEAAERALRLGGIVASAYQAEVTVLGIIESQGEAENIHDSLRRGLALLTEKGVAAELITRTGQPIEEIVRRTEEAKYELVVIGATRKETVGHFWMSSKAYKIIKEIKPPVLLVAGKVTTIKRILICSGGKSYIEHALPLTGQIAQALGANVVLLHVMPEPPGIMAKLPGMGPDVERLLASRSELGTNLRHAKEGLEAMGVPVEVRVRDGDVLAEILEEVHGGEYELIVAGTALSHNFRTYVLGDITREIVNHVRCAVLVVRTPRPSAGKPFSLKAWFNG
jgi:nucleotide-binding universal stress UspA family protein